MLSPAIHKLKCVQKVYIHSDRTGSQPIRTKLPEQNHHSPARYYPQNGGCRFEVRGKVEKNRQGTSPNMKSKYV
jgi:hypothetical protein